MSADKDANPRQLKNQFSKALVESKCKHDRVNIGQVCTSDSWIYAFMYPMFRLDF